MAEKSAERGQEWKRVEHLYRGERSLAYFQSKSNSTRSAASLPAPLPPRVVAAARNSAAGLGGLAERAPADATL